jgi:hypothetical protein
MSNEHTPTPWSAIGKGVYGSGRMSVRLGDMYGKEDSEFLVRAVNAHDDLVALLEEAAEWLWPAIPQEASLLVRINAALAKAGADQ